MSENNRVPVGPYRHARAEPDGLGHSVLLDGEPIGLPGGHVLAPLGRVLAEAVAAEWERAPRRLAAPAAVDALPMFRLAAARQIRVAANRAAVIAELLRFADADLLRHRATGPASLRARETAGWQPWLDWAATRFGAAIPVVAGVMPSPLPSAARHALATALADLEDAALTVLLAIVPALGSLVLGLAVVDGMADPDHAADAATLDTAYAAERAGEAELRGGERDRIIAALATALTFLRLAREP